ncbi:MAG: DNA replication protein [Pseudomonadota bacterium]|nr:DNA replication protein [Pseudomonadota bacterium]
MSQYSLPLHLSPHYSEDNFFVSGCNRDAYEWVIRWPGWPAHALFIHGPRGSGKTHLAQLWAARSQARLLAAVQLAEIAPDAMAGHWAIEDVEQLNDEARLLHLFNVTRESACGLLLTADAPPSRLALALPDLTSRLLSLPLVAIEQPDDAVLAASMRKQFADRQMKVDEEVIAWLLPRMERSLAEAKRLVETIDSAALAGRRNVTVPFVRQLLGEGDRGNS